MFAKTREQPSVVSTRILKTHRLNEVETFRLQGKIRTIDNEIHNNYCQISDEIDGVRKNLNRIKKLKNNLGISVERRKLLREKGVFVLPSPGFHDKGITLRRRDGKKVLVRGKECYDGEIIRRYLDMSLEFSELNVEGNDEDEDSGSESGKGYEETHEKKRLFQYRIISPPLHPGSRRNFKDFDEEYESDIEIDLPPSENYMDSLRKSPYRMRAQTAVGGRRNSKTRDKTRPRSHTRQSLIDLESTPFLEDEQENIQTLESSLGKVSDTTGMPSQQYGQLPPETTATKTKDNIVSKERKIYFEDSMEDSNHESEPRFGKEKLQRNGDHNFNSEIIPTISVVDVNKTLEKDSKKKNRKISAICFSSQKTAVRPQRKHSLPAEPLKLLQRRPSMEDAVKFPSTNDDTSQENTVEPLTHSEMNVNLDVVSPRSVESANSRHSSPTKEHTTRKLSRTNIPNEYQKQKNTGHYPKVRTESFNSIANSSAAAIRRPGSEKRLSTAKNDFIYDARPDKALSKGYTTMQMTIGGKQVRLCVPKFSNDDIVERVRAKSAAKLADDRTRGHAPKQTETTSEKKTTKIPFM